MKGDRSHDETGYGFLYLDAVILVDPAAADEVIVGLMRSQHYEHVLSQRLPFLTQKITGEPGAENKSNGFRKDLESAGW